MAITVKEAQTLYVSYFGRPADFVGLQYWTGTETLVGSLEQLAHSFYNSAEGKKYFPVDPATNQIDVTASINAIYANMFGRVPETAGFDYWYNEIASGKINLAEAAVAIYRGAQGKDALMVENKIAAATQFTDQVAASDKPSLYYGDQAFAKANEFLNTVTDVTDVTSAGFAAQVNAAVNVAEAAGGASSSEGGIFTLTTDSNGNLLTTSGILTNEANVGFEVPTGQSKYLTAGNDVVDLSKWNGTLSVNIGDAFSGDNDKVTVMASALQNNGLKLTSIENLEIVNSGTTASVALNSTNFKGLEAIKLIGDATILNVSGLTQGIKVDATANADYIKGSDKADTINGGAGNDTIIGNDGNDVLTGGNGADTFIVGNAKNFGVDQILDFSAEDKISLVSGTYNVNNLKKFDASTFSTVTYKTLDSVLATFRQDGANQTGSGDVAIFSYDGKTYALLANGPFSEATDALVDITGANVASLTESNFGAEPTIPNPPAPPAPPAPTVKSYSDYAAFVRAVEFGDIKAGEQASISNLTGPEAGLLAVNKTYLDKIAAGGIGDVKGKIVVTIGETGPFDSTAFATKLADSVVKSDIVMDINGSGTAANVIVTSFVGKITGGDDNDIIDAKAGGSIEGGDGVDTITVSGSGAATITGGSGDDIISLGAGKDTVVFADAANKNGVDTITGFKAGSGGDVLAIGSGTNVNGLLGAAFGGANTFVAASAGTGKGDLSTGTAKQVLIHAGSTKIDTTAGSTNSSFSTSGNGDTNYKIGSSQKLFVVDTVNNANILYLVDEGSNNLTVTKVGTLNEGSDITSLTADNFGNVA